MGRNSVQQPGYFENSRDGEQERFCTGCPKEMSMATEIKVFKAKLRAAPRRLLSQIRRRIPPPALGSAPRNPRAWIALAREKFNSLPPKTQILMDHHDLVVRNRKPRIQQLLLPTRRHRPVQRVRRDHPARRRSVACALPVELLLAGAGQSQIVRRGWWRAAITPTTRS